MSANTRSHGDTIRVANARNDESLVHTVFASVRSASWHGGCHTGPEPDNEERARANRERQKGEQHEPSL